MKWFRNFRRRRPSLFDEQTPSEQSKDPSLHSNSKVAQDFFSDTPVTNPESDRFNRWPFAQRIARTIVNRSDDNNLVIGIYGSWGEGKTSVLEFIKTELASASHVICVTFNPWRYPSEEELIIQFYQSVAMALGKSLETERELIGRVLKDYTPLFGLLEKGGSVAKGIVDFLAQVSPEEYKERLEKLLSSTRKRVVIIMDDIDRLNRSEIQTVFRLVKLSADFAYTAYILAFDDEVVADALGEQYGSTGIESGRRFLEKIVTVPLHLPPATKLSLRSLCLEGIKISLHDSGISITPEDQALFFQLFDRLLYLKLRTPRMIKRYNNAILFALPILLGEAYPIDIMLIEGLRVFYTSIYNGIKDNSDVFLCIPANPYGDRREFQVHAKEVLDSLLSEMSTSETTALMNTFIEVFPGLSHSLNGTEFREPRALSESKRIGSKYYFGRYFYYTIGEDDVGDQDIDVLLFKLGDQSQEHRIILGAITTTKNAVAVLAKLRIAAPNLSEIQSQNLAIALAQNGPLFEGVDNLGLPSSKYLSFSSFVYDLTLQITDSKKRWDTALLIAVRGQPIPFIVEFMRWVSNPRYRVEEQFPVGQQNAIGSIVARRIARVAETGLLYDSGQEYATSLLWTWAKWGSKDKVTEYVWKTVEQNSNNITKLLGHYLSFGLFAGAENVRDRYEELSMVVHANKLYEILVQLYGEDINTPTQHDNIDDRNQATYPLRLVHIFSYLYHHPKAEE